MTEHGAISAQEPIAYYSAGYLLYGEAKKTGIKLMEVIQNAVSNLPKVSQFRLFFFFYAILFINVLCSSVVLRAKDVRGNDAFESSWPNLEFISQLVCMTKTFLGKSSFDSFDLVSVRPSP